eukprot:Tamp_20048.p1 GENE.Tamp_20048~~Tamp_20048.p1  ORF type:complete len:301 (+),score=62.71 Tamp_20048:123-1025(+)
MGRGAHGNGQSKQNPLSKEPTTAASAPIASDSRSRGLWWDVGGLANMVSCCAPQTQAQRVLLVEPAGTEGEAPERRTKKKKKKKTAIANPNGSDANGQAAHQGRGEESPLCMQPTTGNSSREAKALTASPEAPNPALPHHEGAQVQEKRGVVFKKGLGLTGTGFIKVAVTSEAASAAREPATPRRPKPLHHASSPLYLQEQRKQQERDRKDDDALEKCNQLGEEIGKLQNLVSELQKIRRTALLKHPNFAGEQQHPAVQKADTELKEAKAKLTDLENKRQKYMDQHQRDTRHRARHGHRR